MNKFNIEISQKEFLTSNSIPSCLIGYFIHKDTGKKIPLGEMSNAKQDNIKSTFDINKKHQSFYDKYNHQYRNLTVDESKTLTLAHSIYLKHSQENIFCADFDEPDIKTIDDLIKKDKKFNIFKNCSYFKGNTKGIHIYFIVENVPEYKSEIDVFKHITGDLIRRKNNMWERVDKCLYGDKKLVKIDFETLKPLLNTSFFVGKNGVKKTVKTQKKVNKNENKDIDIDDNKEEIVEYKEWEKTEITENDRQFVSLLKETRFFQYDDWKAMLWCFKSVGLPFELFDELSQKYGKDKYKGTKDCLSHWEEGKTSKINYGLLHHWAKLDNPEKYAQLKYSFNTSNDEEVYSIVNMSQRYLLPVNINKINDKNDILQNEIIKLFSSNLKSLNLKSPYDTGKTQLIKKIMDTFNPQKVLWLSYRKTLTNDILSNFETNYNFKDYQNNDFNADRLIIQLESVMKIGSMDWEEEILEYPSYDLVIIDEVESVLKQFNSPTFKGKSKECFEFISNVIINSKKLITMDGDIGNRTYNFVSTFGTMTNIVNDIKINKREFKVMEEPTKYFELIKKDLTENKKIVIVSMSATACDTYKKKINIEFPTKSILVYTGNSGDKTKNDFKNVLNVWDKCDVLIYSPTCESGVNFDKEYFNKMYGILAESTTARQFLQK